MDERPLHVPEPLDGYHPAVGAALWALEDARDRTVALVERLGDDAPDWVPPWGGNTIGSLLYHLAIIELDWLYADILGTEPPGEFLRLFPHDHRDAGGRLAVAAGESLDTHLTRLHAVRARLLYALRDMDEAGLHRVRALPGYDVSPAWVIHHLCQHEAEHRGQIGEIAVAGGLLVD
ncbi:MAG: DinB family protein [Actinobacteria bacterium]|nr:DinB family protein [Actinomycetota bacterium]